MRYEGLLRTHEGASFQGGPSFTSEGGGRHDLLVHRSVNEITLYPDGQHRHLYRRSGEHEQCDRCGRLAVFLHVGPVDEEAAK